MFDVEDEYAESDIPTTLIRSKADCPGIEVSYFLLVVFFVSVCVVKHLSLNISHYPRNQFFL